MDKTMLEQRIEERAEQRFTKEFNNLIQELINNPICKGLKVTIGEEDIPLANFGSNYGLLNGSVTINKNSKHTNLEVVKERLLIQYKQEETDAILNKLSSLDYLFQG